MLVAQNSPNWVVTSTENFLSNDNRGNSISKIMPSDIAQGFSIFIGTFKFILNTLTVSYRIFKKLFFFKTVLAVRVFNRNTLNAIDVMFIFY